MPKKPATLHPILWRAVEDTVGSWGQPMVLAPEGETRRRVLRYVGLRQRKTVVPALGGCLGGFALFMAGMILIAAGAIPFGVAAWGLTLLLAAWAGGRLWRVRHASAEEIEAVLPVLRLTRTQRATFESWLALERSGLDEATKGELRAGIDRLVDEDARLEGLLARGAGESARPATIEAERDALRVRLAATADSGAREALEQGLRTCERRLEAAQGARAVTDRVDAQREMIAQAAGDVRDGLLRLEATPARGAGAVEGASVREALAHVQAHAAALEAAVAEVRALDARG